MTADHTTPTECTAIMRLCVPFLDAELDTPEAGEVQAHLDACPRCRGYFEHERSFTGLMKDSLGRDGGADTTGLERLVLTALHRAPARARIWPRALAAVALLMLGAFIGSAGTVAIHETQPVTTGMDADLAARLEACCGLANQVLPDTRVQGGYEQALAEYEKAFAGSTLPHIATAGAPEPRLFGTTDMGGDQVNWVVYCTGAPDFTERFVLLTMEPASMEDALAGLQQLEVSADHLRLLVWRDGDCFRVLITKRDAQWARSQRDALISA